MRFVGHAKIRPNHCCVFPSLGSNHAKGYFESDYDLPGFDNRGYVSVEAVEQMAAKLGWVSPTELSELREMTVALERQVTDLESQLADADRHLSAIEIMESAGFRARKKPGRKPGVKEAV